MYSIEVTTDRGFFLGYWNYYTKLWHKEPYTFETEVLAEVAKLEAIKICLKKGYLLKFVIKEV